VYKDVLKDLLSMLGNSNEKVAPLVLSILAFIGKHRPISSDFPDLQAILVQICTQFIKLGTPKQAKQAIKCMFMNIKDEAQTKVFTDILEIIKENLVRDQDNQYLTAIVALGHIAFYLPEKFPVQVKNLVSRKIVKELVMKDNNPPRTGGGAWCERDELCLEAQCKMAGMKMMA
jgi:sister-chromatid-cohesion protein PDS5